MEKNILELLLVRHGQTDWNVERRVMGAEPISLNAEGQKQIQTLSQHLKSYPIHALYTSPHQRTRESAEILNQHFKLPVQVAEALREVEYGDWVGKTFAEITSLPSYQAPYLNPTQPVAPKGESFQEVGNRAVGFVESLRGLHQNQRVLLVSHADWIKTVLLHYLNIPLDRVGQLRIDNASVTYLILEPHRSKLVAINHNASFDALFTSRLSF